METIRCTQCSKQFVANDPLPPRGPICFRCHVRGVSIGFTYGKADFHGPTVGQRQQEIVSENARLGNKIEPVGKRWV